MGLSTFVAPNYTPDQFSQLFDLSASQLTDAKRYQELRLRKNNLTPDEASEFASLSNTLKDYLITPDRWNHFQEALTNMQWFIKDNVQGYIDTKKTEFQAEVNKLTTRGEYNPNLQYYKKNIVTLQGEGFICLQDTINNPPTSGNHNAYWGLISGRGLPGPKGDPGANGTNQIFKGAWSSAANYAINDLVQYQGNTFSCVQAHTNHTPIDDGIYWRLFLAKGQSITLATLRNTITLGVASVNVPIGIGEFNYATDILFVYVNSVYSEKDVDWVLNANNTSIDKKTGSWATGTVFNFVVLKNMQTSLIYTDGTMLQDGTVGLTKLQPAVQQNIIHIGTTKPTNGAKLWLDIS